MAGKRNRWANSRKGSAETKRYINVQAAKRRGVRRLRQN